MSETAVPYEVGPEKAPRKKRSGDKGPRRPIQRWTNEEVATAIISLNQGLSLDEIGRLLERNPMGLRLALTRFYKEAPHLFKAPVPTSGLDFSVIEALIKEKEVAVG